MMKKNGQTALILILLTAAALIFLAITLNWGRIAQTKVLLSTAADQGASLLASDAASYGESQKQTYLQNQNVFTRSTGIFLSLLLIIVAIIVAVIALATYGLTFYFFVALASVAMSVANLALQVVVVQPGITSLWNSLQKNQPITEQFFEQGMSTALQGGVGDQVNIADYFDLNTNGAYGRNANGFPNDVASRFALFYTERLKMLNQNAIPQVVFFYNQLSELMNGETCAQNENDHANYPSIALNASCTNLNPSPTFCIVNPTDPGCMMKIPNGFQLNDTCTGTNPTVLSTYSPYCDPCCQPNAPNTCTAGNCAFNNPFGPAYPDLYDSTFQNYNSGVSFLDQYGRDQQMGPFTANMTLQGSAANNLYFPNGIYPFFWLMDYYSPQVDNISLAGLTQSQLHWCAASVAPGYLAPSPGFSDLAQPVLPGCAGQECCVNTLASSGDVIDVVGDPLVGPNPAQDASFGEPGCVAPNCWLPGDNEMCAAPSPPYNGANVALPDGTCEWTDTTNPPPPTGNPSPSPSPAMTVDSLDDVLHTFSDFVQFSNLILSNNVSTLSSTFQNWYPQAADWIDPASGRLIPLPAILNNWDNVISNWLNYNYTSATAWCVPSQPTALDGNGSTSEVTYITSNGGTWGSLPSVIACLNYNSNQIPNVGSVYNYQQCSNFLAANVASCPATPTGTPCDPTVLGRSLAGNAPGFDGCTAGFAAWVKNSLTVATNEAPKFALRSLYLQDLSGRANTMVTIFNQGAAAIQNFLSGPAAQLTWAYNNYTTPCGDGSRCGLSGPGLCNDGSSCVSSGAPFPNSVIYGWVDDPYPNGQTGYSHIVKVTAYAPGRGNFSLSRLPWIKTSTKKGFLGLPVSRSYTLTDRDGPVYVSVKRWDEDHSIIRFPDGRILWQALFHNPQIGVSSSGHGLPADCTNAVAVPGCVGANCKVGFGIGPQTAAGLGYISNLFPLSVSQQDMVDFSNAFMLSDNQGGSGIDPNAQGNGRYNDCLQEANQYLSNFGAAESHACAEYIASRNALECAGGASNCSGSGDGDYSLKFYSCDEQPDDLRYGET